MTTLLEWIKKFCDGEEIEGVVLGERPYDLDWPSYPIGKLMSF